MTKVPEKVNKKFFPEFEIRKSYLIALIAIFAAITNVIMIISFPITLLGVTSKIHFIQIPILIVSFGIGPIAGSLVGIIGTISMVFSVIPANPFIIFYNGLFGFFTGLFFLIFKRMKINILVNQFISVLLAFIIQIPFIWIFNTQIIGIPVIVVQVIILKLLFEDLVSNLISHPILYRINLIKKGKK